MGGEILGVAIVTYSTLAAAGWSRVDTERVTFNTPRSTVKPRHGLFPAPLPLNPGRALFSFGLNANKEILK